MLTEPVFLSLLTEPTKTPSSGEWPVLLGRTMTLKGCGRVCDRRAWNVLGDMPFDVTGALALGMQVTKHEKQQVWEVWAGACRQNRSRMAGGDTMWGSRCA